MQLQHLNVFFEVAKAQSILGASKKLRITQPALSRSIQQLEQSLGRKLFLRQARGVSLTAEGRQVFDHCQVIFAECRAIEGGKEESILRLAASENLCLHLIPALLGPGKVELTSGTASEVVAAVMSRRAESGYCYHPARLPGVFSKPLAAVDFVLVHGKSLGKVRGVKRLASLPLIASRSSDYSGPFAAKSLLAQVGLQAKAADIQCNSQEAQVAMAERGLGFTLVPWFVAAPRIKAGKLRELKVSARLAATLFAISREEGSPSARQRAFEEKLKRAAER